MILRKHHPMRESWTVQRRSPAALFRGPVSLPFFLGLKFAFRDDRDRDVQHLGPTDE